jgi:serine/threonine protein kinase
MERSTSKRLKPNNVKDRYDMDCLVGEGAFGYVWKAKDKQTKQPVAIKIFKKGKDGEGVSFTICREIAVRVLFMHGGPFFPVPAGTTSKLTFFLRAHILQLLRELNHENIVHLQDVFIEQNKELYLVFEYAEYDLLVRSKH